MLNRAFIIPRWVKLTFLVLGVFVLLTLMLGVLQLRQAQRSQAVMVQASNAMIAGDYALAEELSDTSLDMMKWWFASSMKDHVLRERSTIELLTGDYAAAAAFALELEDLEEETSSRAYAAAQAGLAAALAGEDALALEAFLRAENHAAGSVLFQHPHPELTVELLREANQHEQADSFLQREREAVAAYQKNAPAVAVSRGVLSAEAVLLAEADDYEAALARLNDVEIQSRNWPSNSMEPLMLHLARAEVEALAGDVAAAQEALSQAAAEARAFKAGRNSQDLEPLLRHLADVLLIDYQPVALRRLRTVESVVPAPEQGSSVDILRRFFQNESLPN